MKKIRMILIILLVLSLGFILKFSNFEEKTNSDKINEKITFSDANVVYSKYQNPNEELNVQITVHPQKVDLKKHTIVSVQLKNKSKDFLIWGEREDNILLEKEINGKWYYSSSNYPTITGQEVERVLGNRSSISYEYNLDRSIGPGKYRFTALFQAGMVAGEFYII